MNRTRARPRDDMGRHPGCSTCSAPLRSARTAAAALLGLIALSGFALAYARSVRRLGWRSSVAGALAALPSVASVLTVSTHQQHGVDAVLDLLRCMLGGMAAFVLCCALIGLLVEPAGVAAAFVLATAAAVLVRPGSAREAGRLPSGCR